MEFKNINPNTILNEFTQAGIKTINGIISTNLNLETMIAENASCEFIDGTDMDKVNEVVANHNPNIIEEKESTTEEILSKEVASLKISDMKKDTIITSTLKTVADLKVEIMAMKGGNL